MRYTPDREVLEAVQLPRETWGNPFPARKLPPLICAVGSGPASLPAAWTFLRSRCGSHPVTLKSVGLSSCLP